MIGEKEHTPSDFFRAANFLRKANQKRANHHVTRKEDAGHGEGGGQRDVGESSHLPRKSPCREKKFVP